MSGYNGFSMSNNAVMAYDDGKMPKSKWTKKAILRAVSTIDPEKAEWLKSVKLAVLKDHVLTCSEWHHTSSWYNETDFFEVDEDFVLELTPEKLIELKQETEHKAKMVNAPRRYNADFKYLEWSGSRNFRKAKEIELKNVYCEEKGCFYHVYDKDGKFLLRKKVGSTGTEVVDLEKKRQDEERWAQQRAEEEKKRVENSSEAANELYIKLQSEGWEWSRSGSIYPAGRKPSPEAYDAGVEKWFRKGEQRLVAKRDRDGNTTDGYELEIWDGSKWAKEGLRA